MNAKTKTKGTHLLWEDHLLEAARDLTRRNLEPFDGDETETLSKLFCLALDMVNGNMTLGEYENAIAKMKEKE